jgi:hypothetical protein
MLFGTSLPIFQRNLLAPSSGKRKKPCRKKVVHDEMEYQHWDSSRWTH